MSESVYDRPELRAMWTIERFVRYFEYARVAGWTLKVVSKRFGETEFDSSGKLYAYRNGDAVYVEKPHGQAYIEDGIPQVILRSQKNPSVLTDATIERGDF